jgi:hypothetical protein
MSGCTNHFVGEGATLDGVDASSISGTSGGGSVLDSADISSTSGSGEGIANGMIDVSSRDEEDI